MEEMVEGEVEEGKMSRAVGDRTHEAAVHHSDWRNYSTLCIDGREGRGLYF